jgi:phage terminase large subunit-like protein
MTSTTLRRSAERLEPFTLEHFRRYCYALRLDSGDRFVLEEFQEAVSADIFAGFAETWMIVPEGNGKTTFMSAHALYHGDYMPSAFVPIGASSREQAEILYRQAEGFVFRTPGLRDRFKCQEGYRRIKCLRTGGRIQVYAADDRTADGIIPTLAMLDELHRHRNLRLYRTWRGKLLKRGGQIATISTAGEPGGEFEDARANMRRLAREVTVDGCHVRAVGEDSVLHDWAVPSTGQAVDMDVVAAANPRTDLTAEVLRKKHDSPTMTNEHWLRFVCNIPSSFDGNGISGDDWDALADPNLDPDRDLVGVGWMDLAWQIDTSAIGVLLWDEEGMRYVPSPVVVEPPVDESDIVRAIVDFQLRFPRLIGWVMDPNAGAQQMAQLLEKGTHPLQIDRDVPPLEFIEHSQDPAPMSLAATRLDEAVRTRVLRHSGDRTMRRHVLNAVRRATAGEKYRFDRPSDAKGEKRAKYPIDCLTGLLMANSVAVAELDRGTDTIFAWGSDGMDSA